MNLLHYLQEFMVSGDIAILKVERQGVNSVTVICNHVSKEESKWLTTVNVNL